METKLLERVEVILKEDGFTHFSKTSSAHSATISAEKGAHRVVMHVTDQEEVPYQAARNTEVPAASDIRVTATMPGLGPNPVGQIVQRAGQGGALGRISRRPRSL